MVTIEYLGIVHKVKALLDGGATSNFHTQLLVKQLKLPPGAPLTQGVLTIDGTLLQTYQSPKLELSVLDDYGQQRNMSTKVVGADYIGFDVILGLL